MPTFKLNGQEIPFEPGDTIIRAAWRQGIEIPHYCWHPGLSIASTTFLRARAEQRPRNTRAVLIEYRFRILEA